MTATMTVQSIAAQALASREAAESILAELATTDRPVTAAELAVLRHAGMVTEPPGVRADKELGGAVSRLASIRRHQARAGNGKHRKALATALRKAESAHKKRGGEIAEAIAALQAELFELEQVEADAREAHNRSEASVAALRSRDMLPPHIHDAHRERVVALVKPLEAERSAVAHKLEAALAALRLNWQDEQVVTRQIAHVRHFASTPDNPLPRPWWSNAPTTTPTDPMSRFNREAWLTYRAECERTIPGLEAELAELDERIAAAQTEADIVLDHLIPN